MMNNNNPEYEIRRVANQIDTGHRGSTTRRRHRRRLEAVAELIVKEREAILAKRGDYKLQELDPIPSPCCWSTFLKRCDSGFTTEEAAIGLGVSWSQPGELKTKRIVSMGSRIAQETVQTVVVSKNNLMEHIQHLEPGFRKVSLEDVSDVSDDEMDTLESGKVDTAISVSPVIGTSGKRFDTGVQNNSMSAETVLLVDEEYERR
jgi:hypothetical protein